MTALELRTSIAMELDMMSAEMLESVSHYVKRLRHHYRNKSLKRESMRNRHESAMQFVKTLSVRGGESVPSDDSGIDALISEKYSK